MPGHLEHSLSEETDRQLLITFRVSGFEHDLDVHAVLHRPVVGVEGVHQVRVPHEPCHGDR